MTVKKSIAIIGEGETEWWYFDTLRIACRYKFKVAPDFPQHSDIPHMAKLAEEYVKRDTDYVVCLVDMDRLLRVPAEMDVYQRMKQKSPSNVIWIETRPAPTIRARTTIRAATTILNRGGTTDTDIRELERIRTRKGPDFA